MKSHLILLNELLSNEPSELPENSTLELAVTLIPHLTTFFGAHCFGPLDIILEVAINEVLGVAAIIRERVIPAGHNFALSISINRARRRTIFCTRDLFLKAHFIAILDFIVILVLKLSKLRVFLEKYYLNFRCIY